jgi:hypothetical protein
VIPRYVGNARHEWQIGETTDDTERTLAVARAILQDRDVRHTTVGREMLSCRKSVHSGVASLWEFHQANDPAGSPTSTTAAGQPFVSRPSACSIPRSRRMRFFAGRGRRRSPRTAVRWRWQLRRQLQRPCPPQSMV